MAPEKPIKKVYPKSFISHKVADRRPDHHRRGGSSRLAPRYPARKARHNITILEANTELDKNPRAAHYASIAIREMRRAGVLEDVQKEGYIPEGVCWREFDGTYIAGIKAHVDDPDVMVCLPLDKLIRLYYRHFQKEERAELLWRTKLSVLSKMRGGKGNL
jgi:2-polyprenyl-6-methoxyphenol hydroxylase-like FAD-dependent oxidoreductase